MGWQSDWPSNSSSARVEKVWRSAIKDGEGRFGPPPNAFLISEMREADGKKFVAVGMPADSDQGGKAEQLTLTVGAVTDLGEQRGMFYKHGAVLFYRLHQR